MITEEAEESSQSTNSRSQPSDTVSGEHDGKGGKPFVQARKHSDSKILGDDSNELSPSMPRRPRPTQIRKAISTPSTTASLTKPKAERERSPSPKPKPRSRSRNQDSQADTDDEAAAANQLVQATLKYVLVSKDPGLVAALKNAIAESPELRELLKD